jgi:hypothetical protein
MAKNPRASELPPTMIIPRGTEINVDEHGQLSVRTPGNLVIQNSGQYGNLESISGSIRIEPGVDVEAVSLKCPETCYVQGSLTVWKLAARSLQLEDTARAHIVLQETERLEVGKGARLVGNFASEKELFFLFSRFSSQVRGMPVYREDTEAEPFKEAAARLPAKAAEAEAAPAAAPLEMLADGDLSANMDLPDALFFALVLLERDLRRGDHSEESRRVVTEIVKLLKEPDLEALRHTYRTLFGRVADDSDKVQRARELIADFFRREA